MDKRWADQNADPPNFRSESHFEILGVEPTASTEAIRHAYLRLIRRYHPDTAAPDVDHEAAAAINRAFKALTTPVHETELRLHPLIRAEQSPLRTSIWITSALATLAIAAVIAVQMVRVGLHPSSAITPQQPPADGRALDADTIEQAYLDLDWTAVNAGVSGAERFSQRCFDGLTGHVTPNRLLFCGAVDARGGQLFPGESRYFDNDARRDRFLKAAAGVHSDARAFWLLIEREASSRRSLERSGAPISLAGQQPSARAAGQTAPQDTVMIVDH